MSFIQAAQTDELGTVITSQLDEDAQADLRTKAHIYIRTDTEQAHTELE